MKLRSLILAALFFTVTAAAQPLQDSGVKAKMMEMQIGQIVSGLKLDDKRAAQFRAIYTRYFKEISTVESKLGGEGAMRPDSLDDQKADQLIRSEFDLTKKSIHIRERYYDEFRTVLSPSEIYRMYGIERQVRRRIMQESWHRLHDGKPGQAPAAGQSPGQGPGRTGGWHGQGHAPAPSAPAVPSAPAKEQH